MWICLPISSSDERIVARTWTSELLCVRRSRSPNAWSIDTRPPRSGTSLPNFSSKRLSSSSAKSGAAMNVMSRSASRTRALLIRDMVILPQHVLERPLFFRVHAQQLLAEVCVLSVAVDVGLALRDGVIEEHQFFF